jgi:hypothetical protein
MKTTVSLLTGLVVAVGLVAPAAAQRGEPASLMLFPEYDNRPGSLTILTVTNTNSLGSTKVEWVYIDGGQCNEFNRDSTLTPNDTLSVLSQFQNPNQDRGYVYVFAKDLNSFQTPVSFNWLIGTETLISAFDGSQREMEPFTFRALGPEGLPTDLDGDTIRDLDGLEYQGAAAKLEFPRFLGQGFAWPGGGVQEDRMILINLTGARHFIATVDMFLWNDNEEAFSLEHAFHCWIEIPLSGLSLATSNSFLQSTNDDPDEVVGIPDLESGWIRAWGSFAQSPVQTIEDPAILAVLRTGRGISGDDAAIMPYDSGVNLNGGLIHNGIIIQGSGTKSPGVGDAGPSGKP